MRVSEFIKRYSSGTPYKFRDFASEVWELVEACAKFDVDGIVEEFGDSVMTFQLWLAWVLPFDWEMCVPDYVYRKFDARMKAWEDIFSKEGLTFYPKYLINGANYAREHKRVAALELARKEQYCLDKSNHS